MSKTHTDDRALAEAVARACEWDEVYPLLVTQLLGNRIHAEHALRTFCKRHGLEYVIRERVGKMFWIDILGNESRNEEIIAMEDTADEADIARTICRAIAQAGETMGAGGKG